MPVEHRLKTVGVYWDAVASGEKTFEVRRNDRAFQKGDIVILQRTDEKGYYDPAPGGGMFSTRDLRRRIGWTLQGGQFGIAPGYIVFSLDPEPTPPPSEGGA